MCKLENFLYSTVRISSYKNNGQISTGTGFFYKLESNPDKPVLICNKHLMNNAASSSISFHIADNNGNVTTEEYILTVENINNICAFHTDEANDICIINIFSIFPHFKERNIKLYYSCITDKMIPTKEAIHNIALGSEVYLLGYPDDLYDKYNKLPILRKGVIATPYHLSYNGTNTFLIDAAIYNGSSGSPILCISNNNIFLLGIQKAMYLHAIGVNSEFITANIKIPNNLGLVTKSDILLTLPI